MKHGLTFVIIMALILSLGYYSVDLVGIFSESSRLEHTNLPRSAKDSGAVYISGEESSFHPMELVGNSNFTMSGYYSDSELNMSSALVAVMSSCNKQSEMTANDGKRLSEYLKVTDSGYIYAEKFSYVNSSGEERFLDCILTGDIRVVYLNFYSQEELNPTPEETESALKTFDSQSVQFYYYVENYVAELEKDFEAAGVIDHIAYKINDSENNFDFFYNVYMDIYCFTYNRFIDPQPPVALFWMSPWYFCNLSFYNDNVGFYLNAYGISHIVEKMIYTSQISEPQYTTYQGRIYQSIFFDRNELITIYNIHDRCIEGFYAPVYT